MEYYFYSIFLLDNLILVNQKYSILPFKNKDDLSFLKLKNTQNT